MWLTCFNVSFFCCILLCDLCLCKCQWNMMTLVMDLTRKDDEVCFTSVGKLGGYPPESKAGLFDLGYLQAQTVKVGRSWAKMWTLAGELPSHRRKKRICFPTIFMAHDSLFWEPLKWGSESLCRWCVRMLKQQASILMLQLLFQKLANRCFLLNSKKHLSGRIQT